MNNFENIVNKFQKHFKLIFENFELIFDKN